MTKKAEKPEWLIAHEKNLKKKNRKLGKEVHKAVSDQQGTNEFRARLPFDGVMGTPPVWLPGTLPSEFVTARDRLLVEYSHEEILGFMDAKESSSQNLEFYRAWHYPHEFRNELETLIYIRYLSRLGKREGLHAYLKEPARTEYEGLALSDAGKKAAGKAKQSKKAAYHELLKSLKARDWPSLLKTLKEDEKALKNFDETGEIYKKRKTTQIRVYEVDEDNEVVTFCNLKGTVMRPVKFKTLKNLIPKYR